RPHAGFRSLGPRSSGRHEELRRVAAELCTFVTMFLASSDTGVAVAGIHCHESTNFGAASFLAAARRLSTNSATAQTPSGWGFSHGRGTVCKAAAPAPRSSSRTLYSIDEGPTGE